MVELLWIAKNPRQEAAPPKLNAPRPAHSHVYFKCPNAVSASDNSIAGAHDTHARKTGRIPNTKDRTPQQIPGVHDRTRVAIRALIAGR